MGLPGVVENVLDGNLNLQSGSSSNVNLFMGPCLLGVANVLYSFGDSQTLLAQLGGGEVYEAAALSLKTSPGQVMVMPLNPTTRGGVSTPVKTGTGAETLALSIGPHAAISYTCVTGGTLGTAAFVFTVTPVSGPAVVSAPITSAAGWSAAGFLIPGTYCNVVFTAGSYISVATPDIYTISTLGIVAHPQGAGPAVPTFTASPVDSYYNAKVAIVTGGALGTMQFTYSMDGTVGATSQLITSTGGGTYAIPGTGIILTFAGTSTATDFWIFSAAGPTYATTDRAAALTALQTTYIAQATYTDVIFIGAISSAAAWATEVAACEAAQQALFALGVYVHFHVGGPTLGTVLPNAGSVTVDAADTDSVVITQRAGMSANDVTPCAGDWPMLSSVSGINFRRNAVWANAARIAKVALSQDVGAYADGGITSSAGPPYRDENATPGFYAAGITCLRTWGAGSPTFLTRGLTGATSNSDYYPQTNSRVIHKACRLARQAALPYVLAKIPTGSKNAAGAGTGVIQEWIAQVIESKVSSYVKAALVESSPSDAVNAFITVTRTNNLLATGNLIIAVSVQGYGYAVTVTLNIGMTTGQ